MPLDAGARLGPYEVVSPLGKGGMGEVYRARDVRLDRDVALKVVAAHLGVSDEIRQRFQREAKAIATLSHPNICSLFDVGSADGSDFLVMELLGGESLAQRLVRGPVPLEQALCWGGQILAALACAHRSGVVHRDLKPANVMITSSGVKLLDFGLAQLRAEVAVAPASQVRVQSPAEAMSCGPTRVAPLTGDGLILGTLQYMAPEQLEGKTVDARTDLFAFGAVFYEMVTGSMAFPGSSMASVISSILRDQPASLRQHDPQISPALERLVARCLAKDPEERWQGAHDLRLQIEGLALREESAVAMAVTRDTGGRARPSVWVASGLVAVVLAAVLAGRLSVPQAAPRSALIRFELPAPDGAVFRSTVETVHVAVSPDGRTVAFLAGPKGLGSDQSAIWLRSLSDAEPRRLTGSDGAVSLFWSPAGDEIGYFAGGRLKRQMVADDARPPVVLCEVSEGIGLAGTWGRDAIVFGSIQGEYIQRVDLSGGEPEILFAADPARNEYRVQWPWFLSDGVSLLYLSSDGEGQSQLMHLPPGGAPRAVAPVRSRVEAAGEDVLVFAADGVLLAQKFDPLTSRLLATPVPVVPWVANFDATKYASFAASPSGTLVAGSGVDDGYLAWYDRSGRELQRVGEPGSRLTITISDDGRRALSDRYQRVRSSYDIGLVDLDRGIETLLVSTPNTEAFPVWLRGDRAFLYSAARGRPPQLMRRDLDSAAETQLLDDPSFQIPVALLSDGRLLLRRRTHQTGFGLVSISLPTSALPARPEFVEILPAASEVAKVRVSPDEHLLAFLASDSGRQEAYLRFLDNTATAFRVSSSGGSAIGWSSDGSELLFTSSDQRLYAAAIETQPSLRITRTEELFQLPALGWTDFDVAPDGRILAIVESAHARSEPLTVIAGWSIDD